MSLTIGRPLDRVVLASLALILGIMIQSAQARAAAITVNNTTDPVSTTGNGFCTLREAINNNNSPGIDTTGGDCVVGSGTDTVNFSVNGTITLGSSLPTIENSLTIDGSGQTIDAANQYGVFVVYAVLGVPPNPAATLNLNNLTIVHGNALYGGAIANSGTLTVTNSTFSGNSARIGGAIYSA